MSSIFKKAMGLFVEFDETAPQSADGQVRPAASANYATTSSSSASRPQLSQDALDKFQKHFDQIFEQTNFPGPDYFEFFKMMVTLEGPIPDERARISAVFASLAIQGMTKSKLLDTAAQYKTVLEQDKQKFSAVLSDKSRDEIDGRKQKVTALEKKISANSELIQKLTKEITDSQTSIATLKNEIVQEEGKVNTNASGYQIAYDAIQAKISSDIQKIQSIL